MVIARSNFLGASEARAQDLTRRVAKAPDEAGQAQAFGRETVFEATVDLLDVDVDHPRLAFGHGKPRLHRVEAELAGGRIDRLGRPAVEYGILADRERQLPAQAFKRARRVHGGSTGL